jgi:ABC-type lipoprotein release transport system permease subunit
VTDPRGAEPRGSAVLEIARSGVLAALLHPLRSAVTVAALVAMLVPFLAGMGISRGVLDQAEDSVAAGADLYVTGERFGSAAPLPLAAAERIAAIPGVESAVPRIVGEVRLGLRDESAVLVGLPAGRAPPGASLVAGRMPEDAAVIELAFGSELARRLGLDVGSRLPPFYRNARGERVSEVVGVFRTDLPIWQSHVVLAPLAAAAEILEEEGTATQVLVTCRPGYADAVRRAILGNFSLAEEGRAPLHPRVVSRDDLAALLQSRVLGREGWFSLHLVLAFAVGVPLLLVSTGFGLSERRREVGLLKSAGWGTDEVLLRSLVESVTVGVAGASVAVLLAFVWLRWLGGAGIAPVFLPGADLRPGFDVPFRLLPLPVAVTTIVALAVATTGSLWSSWRAASAPPAEAMG